MSPFKLLVRAFFERFFDNELVSSAIELRQGLVFVFAFLALPGAFIAWQLYTTYAFAYRTCFDRVGPCGPYAPMIELLSWPHKLFFVTYSMLVVGLAAVVVWDSLTIDRRDAMILGPLPLRATTIVAAKLAALFALLLFLAVGINALPAMVYPFDIADHERLTVFLRFVGAQLASTIGAAAWVFTTLIALQGLLSVIPRRLRGPITIVFQAVFVVTLFSMLALMPAGLRATARALDAGTSRATWLLPPVWFLGFYETLVGSARPGFHRLAAVATGALAVSIAAAVLVTAGAYVRQLRYAVETGVVPSAAGTVLAGARALILRAIARRPDTHAVLTFTIISMTRSRKHQLLLAAYAGAGLALVVAVLAHAAAAGGLAGLRHLRVAVLWIPLVLILWLLVGLRAAFRMPTELAASWTFHVNASAPARVYAPAARTAAALIVLAPVLAGAFAVYWWIFDLKVAAIHVAFCGLMGAALLEVLLARFDQIPFTRAYEAGRANVRAWWPFYILAIEAYAHWPVIFEQWMLRSPERSLAALASMAAALAVLRWLCRRSQSPTRPLVFEVAAERAFSTLELSG